MSDTQIIEEIILLRSRARQDKNWAKADYLREQLKGLGIVLEDNATGKTQWRYNLAQKS